MAAPGLRRRGESDSESFAVVMPTLNAANDLPRALDSIRNQEGITVSEVLVADVGSTDATRDIAISDKLPIRLIDAEKGRAWE